VLRSNRWEVLAEGGLPTGVASHGAPHNRSTVKTGLNTRVAGSAGKDMDGSMDALSHADSVLAALHSQHPECLVPGHVGSPMDDADTVIIPRGALRAYEQLVEQGHRTTPSPSRSDEFPVPARDGNTGFGAGSRTQTMDAGGDDEVVDGEMRRAAVNGYPDFGRDRRTAAS
jgi:hypothetical protein